MQTFFLPMSAFLYGFMPETGPECAAVKTNLRSCL